MSISPENVKKLRKRADLTQTDAGKSVHVSLRTWQNWESSKELKNHRSIPTAYVELFCIKHNIPFPPTF